jgi:putative oxidoreductase
MAENLERIATVAGRVLLAAIFLMSGVNKLQTTEATVAYMENEGMIAASTLIWGAILFEILGAVSVMIGWQARVGAGMLIVFLLIATPIFHDFWVKDPAEYQPQMIMFLKNVSILGGLLIVMARGAGLCSVDNLMAQRQAAVSGRK